MVMTSHSWEEETRKYLSEIQTELTDISKRLEELHKKRDDLTREAEAFITALAVHLRKTGRQENLQQDIKELLVNQINHKERIKRIAEQNNGVLKIGTAADILYNYQIMKSKSRMQAYRTVYGLVVDMVEEGIFQKSTPGEFRLVGTQPKLPVG
jgi:predicted nuclease with TOPRIM domain